MIPKTIRFFYSLKKSKKLLHQALRLYGDKKDSVTSEGKEKLHLILEGLQTALERKEAEIASRMALQLQELIALLLPRSRWDKMRAAISGIGIALLVAIAIRQMWFEFYQIPTGSMRPTIKEGDYVMVSKTAHGINTPFRSGHFAFDQKLVQRGSVIVFTGENMDMPDDETLYFYVIPGKKQYVKRLIGKPGDTLYFYGGQIYGISASGRDLKELRDPSYFQTNEHIPFIRFEGKVEPTSPFTQGGVFPSVVLYQMNQPVARLNARELGNKELSNGQMPTKIIAQKGHAPVTQYGDLWGFKHYGMSRLLTKEQVANLHPEALEGLEEGVLYLEINHHPSVETAKLVQDERGRIRPGLGSSISILPLTQEHLNTLMSHMTTSRFEVKDKRAYRIGDSAQDSRFAPELPNVPDGIYEIQDGVAAKISGRGILRLIPLASNHASAISASHPLLDRSPDHIQTLYNFGFEWMNLFEPSLKNPLLPSRYVYFRNGDLHLMGSPIMKKGDPFLTLFLKREYQKQSLSSTSSPYLPFDDAGAPLKPDGTIDAEFLKQYGLSIPEKMYLVMGDNHAMSADSREFGFVPQNNIRGNALFHFWPPGSRWGTLPQLSSPISSFSLLVFLIAGAIGSVTFFYNQQKKAKARFSLKKR